MFPKIFMSGWTVLTLIVDTALFAPAVILVAPFSKTGRLPFLFCRLWSWCLFKANRVNLDIQGLEHLAPDKSYIFMSNHASQLDPPAVVLALPHTLRFVAKSSLARIPLFGRAVRMAKMIFIDKNANQAALKQLNQSISELRDGISAFFFAEGTRSADGHLLPFKTGGVMLALKAKLPIVPVTITNSQRLWPKHSRRIKPGTLKVVVSPPIEVAGYGEATKADLLEKVRAVIAANLAAA